MAERIFTALLVAETLDAMAIIDRTVEEGECLIWTGARGTGGHPIYKPHGKGCTLVRRAVYHLSGRELVPRQPLVATCGESRCINPDHIAASTITKIAQAAAKRGAYSTLKRCAAIAAAIKHRHKITEYEVQEIRSSEESGPVLALRYGVDKSLINRIKSGQARKDYKNPYLQLMVA